MEELGESRSVFATGVGVVQSLVGQTLALGKGPLDLLRGASGEEKLLKNAKEESVWFGVSALIAALWSLFSGALLLDLIVKL